MKRLQNYIGYIGLTGVFALGVIHTQAASYYIEQTPNVMVAAGGSTGGLFDLTSESPAFVPGVDTVDMAILSISLFTMGFTPSFVTLELDGVLSGGATPVMGSTSINLFDFGGGTLTAFLSDGILAWEVLNAGPHSIKVDLARLQVMTTAGGSGGSNVPDAGATLSLLGAALIGMIFVSRKLKF